MKPIIFHKTCEGGMPLLTIKVSSLDAPINEFETTELVHRYYQKLGRMYRVVYGVGINANIETESFKVMHSQEIHFIAYLGGR